MPAQHLDDWSPAVIVASNTALRDLLDAHSTDPAYLTFHDEDDVLLARIDLEKPSGTVDSETGELTLTPDGREESAPATGVAAYCSLHDGEGDVHCSVPCEAGLTPVPGKCVMNTTTVLEGGPVEIVSLVIA